MFPGDECLTPHLAGALSVTFSGRENGMDLRKMERREMARCANAKLIISKLVYGERFRAPRYRVSRKNRRAPAFGAAPPPRIRYLPDSSGERVSEFPAACVKYFPPLRPGDSVGADKWRDTDPKNPETQHSLRAGKFQGFRFPGIRANWPPPFRTVSFSSRTSIRYTPY